MSRYVTVSPLSFDDIFLSLREALRELKQDIQDDIRLKRLSQDVQDAIRLKRATRVSAQKKKAVSAQKKKAAWDSKRAKSLRSFNLLVQHKKPHKHNKPR
jgi:hypothetical protein